MYSQFMMHGQKNIKLRFVFYLLGLLCADDVLLSFETS